MSVIDWALYSERAVGRGSLTYTDVINRPLREVLTASGQDPDASFPGFSLAGHTHDASAIVSGTLAPARGGTGLSSPTAGGLLVAAAAAAMTLLAPGASGQVVRSNGSGWAAAAIVSADISDAASINTPSRVVIRDASGNFVAGTITAVLAGNASTASALATPRAINGVNFDGSAAITVKASTTNALTIGAHLTGSSFDGSAPITIATDATAANTVSTIVARDGSGNFAAGVITASFTGALTGNAATATKFASTVNINGVAFDGSAGITVAAAANTLTGTTLAANVVASSLTGVGTLTSGTWSATLIAPAFGGTGVANGNTITVGGNVNTAAAFTTVGGALTLTLSGGTNVTLPTSGTLVNTAVTTLASLSTVGTLTAVTVIGTADLQGGVKVAGGTFAAGHSFFVSATTGLNILGHAGGSSTADFTLLNNQVLGQTVMDVPTGTFNARFSGAVSVATGLTVLAGTTAVQALTATTGTFSSTINGQTISSAASFTGSITATTHIRTIGTVTAHVASSIAMDYAGGFGRVLVEGPDPATLGQFLVTLAKSDGSSATAAITATSSAVTLGVATAVAGTLTATGILGTGGGRINISGTINPNLALDDGTGTGFVQVVAGDINFSPRAGKSVTVSSDFNIGAGKFVVAGSNGNTTIAGTLTANNGITVSAGGAFSSGAQLITSTLNGLFVIGKTGTGVGATDFVLANGLGGTVMDVPAGLTVARFAASAAAAASIRLPHGSAPTSPIDGDVWTTSAGVFARINGVTKTFTLT